MQPWMELRKVGLTVLDVHVLSHNKRKEIVQLVDQAGDFSNFL